jgi:predicted small lipoprotein YifL
MKKIFAAVLATAMMFTMAGCKSLYQLDPASKTEQELGKI